jgi:hypothetical protein
MPIYVSLLFMLMNCNAQENPKYIDAGYGVFHLDKITFSEQLDSLFSKTEKYYKLPKGEEYFNDGQKKYALKDTVYYIYRIPSKFVAEGTFRFKNLAIKPKEVVDFYADDSGNFRKIEVSVYLNDQQYRELIAACKDLKDHTPENVRKVNSGKYVILQNVNAEKQIQTTLYCLDNRHENNNDPNQNYFVRISKTSLQIRTDKFYKQFNDDMKAGAINHKD